MPISARLQKELRPCLSPRGDLFLLRTCTCRKNGRSKRVAFHDRITFSWLLRFRAGFVANLRRGACISARENSFERLSNNAELCKTISTTGVHTLNWLHLISKHESWIVSSMSVLVSFFLFTRLAILVSRIVHDSDSHSLERKSPKLKISLVPKWNTFICMK